MRTLAACAAFAVLIAPDATAGAAAPDPMEAVYDNTITIFAPPLYAANQYIDRDHTWREVSDQGVIRGTWSAEDGRTCFVQVSPPGPTRCYPHQQHKVGDTWTNIDQETGATVYIGLEKGRSAADAARR